MSFLDLFRKKSKYNVKPKHNIPREVYGIPSPSKFDVKPEDNIEETIYEIKDKDRNIKNNDSN